MTKAGRHGFTLIEVVAALAILSVVVLAVLKATGENVRVLAALEERAFAEIAADNTLIGLFVEEPYPEIGDREGATTIAGRRFNWAISISSTADIEMRRIDVFIRDVSDERVIVETTAFRGRR